jgi:hypothetical protein
MASIRRSVLTTEYIKVPVTALQDGSPATVSGDVAWLAFPIHGSDPVDGDWQVASWETDAGQVFLICLVGPGHTFTLPVGRYDIWVKVADNPEIPVRKLNPLVIS